MRSVYEGMMRSTRKAMGGFTIAELITVTTIVVLLASTAIPVAHFAVRRHEEDALRARLARLGWAIDRYEELRSEGVIKEPPAVGQGDYPKTLEELTKPIELKD